MQRLAEKSILDWKHSPERMPLLIDGARQVGKSYLVEHRIAPQHFKQLFKLDFLQHPQLSDIFSGSKEPSQLLKLIQLELGLSFDPTTDLLFFDEIGECQNALDSLKYFQEQRPDIFLIATSSNIGLLKGFPVGKVNWLKMRPMCFEEYLMAFNEPVLLDVYQAAEQNPVVHKRMWSLLLDYYFVGGMPKAVKTWVKGNRNEGIIDLTKKIRTIHEELLNGYRRDFSKFGNYKSEALDIERVFNSIPSKLMHETDGTAKKYTFTKVIEGKKSYSQFRSSIEYLLKIKLASISYIIEGKPTPPLKILIQESRFKLWLFDIGILHAMLEIPYKQIIKQAFNYKGFIAENFVANELLVAADLEFTYSWTSNRNAELEFLLNNYDGAIIPIEVKSGKSVKSKSLSYYINQYQPTTAYKLSGRINDSASFIDEQPLYYAAHIAKKHN